MTDAHVVTRDDLAALTTIFAGAVDGLTNRVEKLEKVGTLEALNVAAPGTHEANLRALLGWTDKRNWTLAGDEDAVRRQSMVLDHIHTLLTRWAQGGVIDPPDNTEVVGR